MSINKELRAIIDSTCDLPPMPVVAGRIVSMVSNENVSAKALERAISADQALTANILKIANSSFYGCLRSINSLASAIVIIGFRGIKTLAVAASLKSFYRRIDLIEKMLWEHSLGAAIAAHLLGRRLHCFSEEAFIAGLMHDIGKVILNTQMNEVFCEMMQISYNNGTPLFEVERGRLGFTHAELGGIMIRKWNLSTSLEQAVTYHHNLGEVDALEMETIKFAALLNLANTICKTLGIGYRQPSEEIDYKKLQAVQMLKVTEMDFPAFIAEVKRNYDLEKGNF